MWTDAIDLRDFYASGLGRVARRMIGRRIRAMWPDVHGLSVLGIGYATPYLGAFRAEAARALATMPQAQGVVPWPSEGPRLTALVNELELPFADRSMDRILVVHALECAEPTRPLLRELWRVLTDGGRLLIVVPNRRGLWAQLERTPLGFGRPYSPGQLTRGLGDTLFAVQRTDTALYVPPVNSNVVLSAAAALEQVGRRWFTGLAGVIIVEASKEIYSGRFTAETARATSYVPIGTR